MIKKNNKMKHSGLLAKITTLSLLVLSISCAKVGNFPELLDPNDSSDNSSSAVPDPSDETSDGGDHGSGEVPSYKPEALAWESSSKPERLAWSEEMYDLADQYYSVLSLAKDVSFFCPTYADLSREERINLWANIIASTTYYESSWNPLSASVDVGTSNNKDTWSVGLLQLSVVDQQNYGFSFGYNYADLQNPIKNLRLGMAILAKQITKKQKILIPQGESGTYWAVLHPGGKYDKSASIAAMTKKHSYCK